MRSNNERRKDVKGHEELRELGVQRIWRHWHFMFVCLLVKASASALAVLPEVRPTHTQTSWFYWFTSTCNLQCHWSSNACYSQSEGCKSEVLGFSLKLGGKILCGSSGSVRDTAKHQWQKTLAGYSEQNSRKHILLSDETKIKLFGSEGVRRVWQEPSHDFHNECITVLTVKHRGGRVPKVLGT